MHIDDLIPSKYLKRSDVEPPKIVTIRGLKREQFEDKGQMKTKWAMSFEELDKPLLLNKTNIKRCAKACGSEDTDDWVGKKIKIYFDEDVEYGGEQVGGIRVTRANGKSAPVDELDDGPPF